MPSHEFLRRQICFNAIRENKILGKILEFTVNFNSLWAVNL